ncbi:PREDICTED: serine/arginine repetitive matrix protein 4 [Nanorana parkeri]|uniref:serine/arginine repetitive matrix protein 4 n=1 Tax=Nanorana parkeri TaxID=125878 RepID=UPI0008544BE4|nr:PREDICTED: serine/arginine repetitive matrix protein 4 [Nanorana parkeri]
MEDSTLNHMSTEDFIGLVQAQVCLYDQRHASCKSKGSHRSAWWTIGAQIWSDWDGFSPLIKDAKVQCTPQVSVRCQEWSRYQEDTTPAHLLRSYMISGCPMAKPEDGKPGIKPEEVNSSPSADQEDTKYKKQNGDVENGRATERHGRTLSPRQHHSDCLSEAGTVSPSPPPKAKKKKKKSVRKKRKRSQSYSPSPVKKKKKKSSKKRKRNRSSSKRHRHSSTSPKNKRKQVRKHRKHSRGRSRKSHHHHHRHSRSVSSESRSSSFENRPRVQSREKKHQSRRKKHKYHHSRSVNKKQKEAPPLSTQNSTYSTKLTISQSVPSLLVTAEHNGGCQKEVTNEYDSGNEMCSTPSTQSSSSVLKLSQEKDSPSHQGFGHVPSSVKTPNGHSDNISDSGNSSASSFSFTKESSLPLGDSGIQAKRDLSSCLGCLGEHKSVSDLSPDRNSLRSRRSSSSYKSTRRSYSSSSSHSISSYTSSYRSSSNRRSRSRSTSSGARSYSRSPSYSSKSGRKSNGSRRSRSRRSPSYSRYSPSRDRSSKYNSTENGTRKGPPRTRRSSYSPMRKRRRDSPSHLEARRITSARKRPIPYYRRSPSSSSSASSIPSWYSPRSRSRSRSYFSHRSSRSRSHSSRRSHSSDWKRSRSRSRSLSQSSDSCDSIRR